MGLFDLGNKRESQLSIATLLSLYIMFLSQYLTPKFLFIIEQLIQILYSMTKGDLWVKLILAYNSRVTKFKNMLHAFFFHSKGNTKP